MRLAPGLLGACPVADPLAESQRRHRARALGAHDHGGLGDELRTGILHSSSPDEAEDRIRGFFDRQRGSPDRGMTVALDRAQLLHTLVSEAMVIGACGGLLAIAWGWPLARLVVTHSTRLLSGWRSAFRLAYLINASLDR